MRPIDADAFWKLVMNFRDTAPEEVTKRKYTCNAILLALLDEKETPTIETEPKRGRWEITEDDFYMGLTICKCTACREEFCFEDVSDIENLNYNFCPNCGADMREADDG